MGHCFCRCHNEHRGVQKAAQQMGKYMKGFEHAARANFFDDLGSVQTEDALEAAVACRACQAKHCDALSSRTVARPRIVKKFDPNSDSQRGQADGEDGG